MNIFKLYVRNFNKNKSIYLITIGGFAISLALFLLIIGYVVHEKGFDRTYPNIDRMYRFVRNNDNAKVPLRSRVDILNTSAEIDKLCFYNFNEAGFKYNHQNYKAVFLKTDEAFFDIFSVKFLEGQKKGVLASRDNVIVTASFAKKHFGESNAIGKELEFFGQELKTVVAVVADPPEKSCITYGAIVNQDNNMFNYQECKNGDCYLMYNTAMLLKLETDYIHVGSKLKDVLHALEGYKDSELSVQKFSEVYFNTDISDINRHANVKFIKLLTVVAFVILLLSILNFVNLSIASHFKRIKEVCIRKTSGAKAGNVMWQFIGESYITCFISIFLAIVFIFLFSPVLSNFLNLDFNIHNILLNPYWLLSVLFLVLVLGWAIGYIPAKIVASYKPVQLLRKKGGHYNSAWSGILNVIQFAATILLVSGLLVINKQIEYSKTRELGYDSEQLVYFPLSNQLTNKYGAIKNSLLQIPSIENVAGSQGNVFNIWNMSSGTHNFEGEDVDLPRVAQLDVDDTFLETMGVPLLMGRNFRKTDKKVCIINETLFNNMQTKSFEGKKIFGCQVIGVIPDIHFQDLHQPIGNLELRYGREDPYLGIVNVRIKNKNIPAILSSIESVLKEFDPECYFEPGFYNNTVEQFFQHEKNQASAIKLFALMAILLSCLGLYGKVELSSKTRTKEIGIRKVNGAKIFEVLALLNKDFLMWISIALFIAIPVGYFLMKKWLENFAYRTELSWWVFALAAFLTLMVALLTVTWKSYVTASRNPVESLRYE